MVQASEEEKTLAFEHAWKWFEYHATQRMTTIRFYLIVAGAIGTGIGYLWSGYYYFFATILSGFGVIASICFLRLDTRVSHLVKIGEAALKQQQSRVATDLQLPAFEMCQKADALNVSSAGRKFRYPYSYSENISVLIGASTAAFAGSCLLSLLAATKIICPN